MTDEEFWATTPKIFYSLMITHTETLQKMSGKKQAPTKFIDQIAGW